MVFFQRNSEYVDKTRKACESLKIFPIKVDGGRARFVHVGLYVSKKISYARAVACLDAKEKHNTLRRCEFLLKASPKGHTQVEI